MFSWIYTVPFWDTAYGGGPIPACKKIKKNLKIKKLAKKNFFDRSLQLGSLDLILV